MQGRTLLWGWDQEKRPAVDKYDYAGCLSLPRVLTARLAPGSTPDKPAWEMHQHPAPEQAVASRGCEPCLGNNWNALVTLRAVPHPGCRR